MDRLKEFRLQNGDAIVYSKALISFGLINWDKLNLKMKDGPKQRLICSFVAILIYNKNDKFYPYP